MKYLLFSTIVLSISSTAISGTTFTPTQDGGVIKKTTEFQIDKEKTEEAREEEQEQKEDARKDRFKAEEKQLKEAHNEHEESLEDIHKEQKERLKRNQEELSEVEKEEEARKQVKEVRGEYKVRTEKVNQAPAVQYQQQPAPATSQPRQNVIPGQPAQP